jgi:hypothetical protein
MKRVEAASGAKYSVHNESARRQFNAPIAPTGTAYTPIGRPDIAAMKAAPPAPSPAAARPVPAAPKSASSFLPPPKPTGQVASATKTAPQDAWPDEAPKPRAAEVKAPAAPTPPVASRPVFGAPAAVAAKPAPKPDASVRCSVLSNNLDADWLWSFL